MPGPRNGWPAAYFSRSRGAPLSVGLLRCYLYRVSTLAEIEAAADALPKEQKEQLLSFLAARLGWALGSIGAGTSSSVRRAGLHAGVWEVAHDFDASLPDEFWLDRNA
jgi:hypothetical protein